MTSIASLRPRALACEEPRGTLDRDLAIGPWRIRFEGLDDPLDRTLAERWAGFWTAPRGAARRTVRVVRGDGSPWIPPGPPGERYRLEADAGERGVLACSYRFALVQREGEAWSLVLEDDGGEPVGLSPGAVSLGDDYAVLLRTPRGWEVPPVPFDNAERAPTPPSPAAPLALVCRLHHAPRPRLERPSGPAAHAGLMACLAFPWALPDLSDRLHEAVDALVASGRFAELWFARDPSFWELLG